MRRRIRVTLVLATVYCFVTFADPAQARSSSTTIAGPDLPIPVTLAWQDEVALLDPPSVDVDAAEDGEPPAGIELLTAPPAAFDPLYTVASRLWSVIGLRVGLTDVGRRALYDSALGVARVEGSDGVAWLRIEPSRRAILERYIVLGRKGVLEPQPNILEVLRAARRNRMGGAIIIDGHEIGPGRWDARLLWAEIERANAREAGTYDFILHPSYPPAAAIASTGGAEPVVFGAADSASGSRRIDPASTPAPGDAEFTFRLRDGQEITFLYIAATGMLVDVSPLDREPQRTFPTLSAFEMTSEFQTLVNRLVETGGVAIDDEGLRLGDVIETTGGPWPPPGWQPPAGAVGLAAPTPEHGRWLNHRVAAGVRAVEAESLHFVALTGAALAAVLVAGLLRPRR